MRIKLMLVVELFLLFNSNLMQAQQPTVPPFDAMLTTYAYPFPVYYFSFVTQKQKLEMAYMDVKPAKPNGKTVLLLHGKNFNGAYWKTTANALSNKGFRVIIPDQIGFGKSSKPENFHYTFQALAINTKKLLDTLGITSVNVVGHSMGGMLATRFSLMYPQTVEKLVLLDAIGLEDWKIKAPYVPIDTVYKNELKQTYHSLKQYQIDNYYHGTWKPEYEEWLLAPTGWLLGKDVSLIAWNSALTYDMIFTQPVCYEFQYIKVPTLIMNGELDQTALGKNMVSEEVKKTMGNYVALGKQVQQQIPHSKLIVLKGVGHLPHIEAFNSFIQPFLEFLQQ